MVHCKQNNVDIKSFLAPLLLVTSQTRSASVESREVEALSNLRRRRPRGPSLGRISRRKAAAVSLENKNFTSSMYVSGAGPRPCSFFLGQPPARFSRIPPNGSHRCVRDHIGRKAVTIRLADGPLAQETFDANDHSRRCRAGCGFPDQHPRARRRRLGAPATSSAAPIADSTPTRSAGRTSWGSEVLACPI